MTLVKVVWRALAKLRDSCKNPHNHFRAPRRMVILACSRRPEGVTAIVSVDIKGCRSSGA